LFTRSTGSIACLALALALGACVNPGGKFDDFVDRIPDATPEPDGSILLEIPDISGRFFIGLASVVDVDLPILFIAENTLHANPDGSATLDSTIQPLDYTTLMPAGEALVFAGVPISMTGQFDLTKATTTVVEGTANPITGTTLTLSTITLLPTIKGEDLYCGQVTGNVTDPLAIDLTGSNMAAIRVPDGAIGTELPDPVGACPPDSENPDAGTPDAMPADASIPIPDAGVPDAEDDNNDSL